jgi:predicted transposase YbfD/YdcC
MSVAATDRGAPSRLRLLLDHFALIEDARESHRVAFRLDEILLLAVCGTIADCDDYDAIAAWGEAHLDFLRRFLEYHHGVPCGRWLTIMMNRINPALFSACFTNWVRACWPDRLDLIAIDGKTSRGSHDRGAGQPPLHLVSAFATTSKLVLAQEAVPDKSNELTAIPLLLERLAADGGLEGALVSIDAIACNAKIAGAIRDAGADYLLAVKANQPTLLAETELVFADAEPERIDVAESLDKGHGRIETRRVTVTADVDWLSGDRRFPGELRFPDVGCLVKVESKAELRDRCRLETRYYISSAVLSAREAATAVRNHWSIENQLHWVLDVDFAEDQARLRKGHGARNMAVIRHFAINAIRTAPEPQRPPRPLARRRRAPDAETRKTSLKLRRKLAGWDVRYLDAVLRAPAR